ncbi:hypothetical protein [Ahrensia sp. 13_GOM-1096m]|uniref:hypothetical protein n=1 Tax=Ahrensia sp. 13_GOM-1096m TaxID=1380380 RepID=UPI000687F681|nr:hypothetical protein [Ahrensia sp. 13_GOM-1096m]
MNENKPPLDRWRFDELLKDLKEITRSEIIWGHKAISNRIGTSEDFVRKQIAQHPNSPLKKLGGKVYAVEHELVDFLRQPDKPA